MKSGKANGCWQQLPDPSAPRTEGMDIRVDIVDSDIQENEE